MKYRHRPFSVAGCPGSAGVLGLMAWIALTSARLPAFALDSTDAKAMFNAYSNAYYSLTGTNACFKNDQSGGKPGFWETAEEIECIIDVYERTSNSTYQVMMVNLLNGFAEYHGTNWSSNSYNDDCLWACIAFARGYQNTGNPRFRDIARWNFDRIYARAWDARLGGGLYWTTANRTKNACVNGPGGIAACLLYQIDGDPNYRARAGDIYQWERSTLFDPATGAVADAMATNGAIHTWTSSYNQGTFIGLANFLGFTNEAMRAANYTRDHLTDCGILPQYGIAGNNSGFNAIFLRWMARFMRDHGLESTYQPWLKTNAEAAWNARRTADGLSWCQWRQKTPAGMNLQSWDCIASLEAVHMLLPAPGAGSHHNRTRD